MQRLETSLRSLGEDTFRRILLSATNSSVGSVASGMFATSILQSSSMVGLMVLAMVGSGILPLANAIGMMVGADLGTTITGWLVTLIGFKLSLTMFALPMMGLGGLAYISGEKHPRLQAAGLLLFAFGLLIFGLDTMKNSVSVLKDQFRPEDYAHLHSIVFVLMGIGFTAIIQSSSACMLITLNALSAGLVDLPSAAAIVIGADLGTTSTIIIGSIKGSDNKRRVAAADFLFNLGTASLAYLLVLPFIDPIFAWLGISDPLYALVAFHSLFNLLGVMLVFPFIRPLARQLQRRFHTPKPEKDPLLADVPAEDVAIASIAIEKALKTCCMQALRVNNRVLKLPEFKLPGEEIRQPVNYETEYAELRDREGQLGEFILDVLAHAKPVQKAQLRNALKLLRHIGYAVKAVKEIKDDLQQAGLSTDKALLRYKRERTLIEQQRLAQIALWVVLLPPDATRELRRLQRQAKADHLTFIDKVYDWIQADEIEGETFIVLTNISKHLLNMNKQWVSCLELLHAVKNVCK